ncbi:sigma factor [Streptosporangium saharense]|uniref:sigma factor n=1 Tax=Streptosporangium saharense TaxID=1706840 RepID=UPI003686EE60
MAEVSAGTLAEMLNERRHLIEIARWMFGSETMADRIVQETYRRWYTLTDEERTKITAPRAWLTKVAGSICLDLLATPGTVRSIVGPGVIPQLTGIPDAADISGSVPQLSETPGDPPQPAISSTARPPGPVVSPGDMPQPGISGTAWQPGLVAGPVPWPEFVSGLARHQAGSNRAVLDGHDRVVRRFAEVCALGNVAALREILTTGAIAVSDGGGKLRAAVHPVYGADAVARFVMDLLAGQPGTEVTAESVNGRTGLVLRQVGQAVAVVGMSVAGAMVTAVWIVLNPDKLQPWHRP